jgi:hypothetical protein
LCGAPSRSPEKTGLCHPDRRTRPPAQNRHLRHATHRAHPPEVERWSVIPTVPAGTCERHGAPARRWNAGVSRAESRPPILRAHNRQPSDQTHGARSSAEFQQSRQDRTSRPIWCPRQATGWKPSAWQNPCRITPSDGGSASILGASETCDTQAHLDHEHAAGPQLPAVYLKAESELVDGARRLLDSFPHV